MDEPSPLPTTEPDELELLSSPESPEDLLLELLLPELLDLCEELPELLLPEDLCPELPPLELLPWELLPLELLLLELPPPELLLLELLELLAACCLACSADFQRQDKVSLSASPPALWREGSGTY